jgi:hypothetical protein
MRKICYQIAVEELAAGNHLALRLPIDLKFPHPMAPDQRHEELVEFIRDNTNTVPWPQVQDVLHERGYTSKEIAKALDEVFPGQKGAKKKSPLWGGMVGALVGIVVWVVFAILYRMTR